MDSEGQEGVHVGFLEILYFSKIVSLCATHRIHQVGRECGGGGPRRRDRSGFSYGLLVVLMVGLWALSCHCTVHRTLSKKGRMQAFAKGLPPERVRQDFNSSEPVLYPVSVVELVGKEWSVSYLSLVRLATTFRLVHRVSWTLVVNIRNHDKADTLRELLRAMLAELGIWEYHVQFLYDEAMSMREYVEHGLGRLCRKLESREGVVFVADAANVYSLPVLELIRGVKGIGYIPIERHSQDVKERPTPSFLADVCGEHPNLPLPKNFDEFAVHSSLVVSQTSCAPLFEMTGRRPHISSSIEATPVYLHLAGVLSCRRGLAWYLPYRVPKHLGPVEPGDPVIYRPVASLDNTFTVQQPHV
mmetsp:Transcript_18377/g.51863  ORF Transcript_18377/g.51863 Transcript_18377/m.51863 type:complete len:358 (+) Transcript_18377:176-1249(+)